MVLSRGSWMQHGDRVSKLELGQRLMQLLPRALRGGAPSRPSADADVEARGSSREDDLLTRLQRAEPAAIDQLYRAHHAALRAYAQRLIGDPAVAEDVVHDLFVALPSLLARFRGESSLRSFLMGVITQLSIRHVSNARRRRMLLARFSDLEQREWATPESQYTQSQRVAQLSRALDVLPFAQRAAFVLCEVEERSAAEAAQILAVPEATIRTRCFHARKKLSESLRKRSP
jgi:RNA polymerase sigma-70 factor (ECF subfamily)